MVEAKVELAGVAAWAKVKPAGADMAVHVDPTLALLQLGRSGAVTYNGHVRPRLAYGSSQTDRASYHVW